MRYLLLLAIAFSLMSYLKAQDDFYYEDFVYLDDLRSVKLSPLSDPSAFPIVQLNGRSLLHFEFDDLDAVDKRYTYHIIHCDRNWNKSQLEEVEYLDGFNGEEIRDSYHSMQTKVDYVHYDLYLPNDYVSWTVSGNYLLVIYDEEDLPVITKRFMVVEPLVSVNAEIKRPKKVSQLRSHHALEIDINFEDFYIRDPLNELSVTVMQNFRWLDAIEDVKPKNVMNGRLTFDPFDPFLFPALKDFRNFDTRSLLYTSRYIYSIHVEEYKIDVLLEKDRKRTFANFITELDMNGNFITGNKDHPNGVRGAEYVNVAFTLESSTEFDGYDVYIIGGFSDWQLYDSNIMTYDPVNQYYQADLLLKQGFYDYYYALVDQEGNINLESLEGNWYETDNTYYILVYLREFGAIYDKLIAMYAVK